MFHRAGPSQIIVAVLVGAGVFLTGCVFALAVPEAPNAVHHPLITQFVPGCRVDVAYVPALVGIATDSTALRPLAPSLLTAELTGRGPASARTWTPAQARAPPVLPHRRI